jgi:hypothetical protein
MPALPWTQPQAIDPTAAMWRRRRASLSSATVR